MEQKSPPPHNTCFVCGQENPRGLRVRFAGDGERGVTARWSAVEELCGFPGIVHGGIVSALLDEAMSKAVAASGPRGLTCDLRVRLRETVRPCQTLEIRGWVVTRRKRRIAAEAEIRDGEGRELAHGWATFLLPR